MPDSVEQTGRWLLRYLPLISGFALLVASATTAQLQININAEAIKEARTAVETRVPTFLYDRDRSFIETELIELAGNVKLNEELVDQLERSTDQIDGKIELEIERLRNAIAESDREQAAKLELILNLLEQELRNNP